MIAVADQKVYSSWEARLRLGLTLKNGKTILNKRRHDGPLTLQRPFYPEENGTCHLYILHPPGGVVGGDALEINVRCEPDTSTLITTPAANKFYKSNGCSARQCQILNVRDGACLEWLPQETILFDGSMVESNTRVQLSEDAIFVGWEIISFGRPACNEEFTNGFFKQCFEIWKGNEPLLIDRLAIQDRPEVFKSMWGLRKKPVMGLMTVVSGDVNALCEAQDEIRDLINDVSRLSVTVIGRVLLCRCLDFSSMAIRDTFIEIWKSIRLKILNKSPCEPRIWAT